MWPSIRLSCPLTAALQVQTSAPAKPTRNRPIRFWPVWLIKKATT